MSLMAQKQYDDYYYYYYYYFFLFFCGHSGQLFLYNHTRINVSKTASSDRKITTTGLCSGPPERAHHGLYTTIVGSKVGLKRWF